MATALASHFMEGETGVFRSEDDDVAPEVVAMVVKHMYGKHAGFEHLDLLGLTRLYHFGHE
ncbi:Hypothetical protein D9617_43g040110 [Elsinoe fawcettii]|nr:Hypothetical protein D9617_43g040110 [Elsinoe fawcettii]